MGLCYSKTKAKRTINLDDQDDFQKSLLSKDFNLQYKIDKNNQTENDETTIAMDLPDNITWKDTRPFIPPIKTGKVIKVYDGDTITLACKIPFLKMETTSLNSQIYRFNIRLNGINCPEMKSKNKEEKNAAIFIQQNLENLILNKYVILENISLEKYGRILADVILINDINDNININNWLINNNYAVKYDGGTKMVPVHWKTYMGTGKGKFKKINST